MLEDMLAKNAAETGVRKGKGAVEIDQEMDVMVFESIHVDPVGICQTAWTRTQVEKGRCFSLLKKPDDPHPLKGNQVLATKEEKINIPTRDSEQTMTKEKQKQPAHDS